MINSATKIYDFVFRGLLAEEALDAAGRRTRLFPLEQEAETARTLSIDLLDDAHVVAARSMAHNYEAVAAIENAVKQLI